MINSSWDEFLNNEFSQPYFKQLSAFLRQQYEKETVYPAKTEVFSSFYFCDMDKVRVVILGQDPYHEPNQACGMAFAVKPGVALPPSLRNIYQEISQEMNVQMNYANGYLLPWEKQGVLLLNSVLTVEKGKANSHKGRGWEIFTDHVIEKLDSLDQPMVFLLWGANARANIQLLKNPHHLVLQAAHPSPLSAYNGFFGCGHFLKVNEYLKENGQQEIDWRIQ